MQRPRPDALPLARPLTLAAAALAAAALAACLTLAPATALAQPPHPRRARVMYVISADQPAVLVSPTEAWAPMAAGEEAISVCGALRCGRVVERQSCEPPACPGGGPRLVLDRPVADVDELPEDAQEWEAELQAMNADAALASLLASYRGAHPGEDRPDLGWRNGEREEWQWELSFAGSVATTSDAWSVATGGTLSLGFRFSLPSDLDEDDVTGFFETVFGDTWGADLRVHYWHGLDAQDPGWLLAVGFTPRMLNAVGEGRLRVPAFPYGIAVPEMGIIARGDRPAAFYLGFELPIGLLLTDGVGVEARGAAFLVPGWAPGEDASEWLFSASLAAVLR